MCLTLKIRMPYKPTILVLTSEAIKTMASFFICKRHFDSNQIKFNAFISQNNIFPQLNPILITIMYFDATGNSTIQQPQ